MLTGCSRRRAGRFVAVLLLVGAGALTGAGAAEAAPWGPSGADYTGVLCRLGGTDVPMGAWTVNGSVAAFSTADVTGSVAAQADAPVAGAASTMVAGDAGFSAGDIATVAYLLNAHQGGSPADLAQLGADVAKVAGGGAKQQSCLGRNGTSAGRAASWLREARRRAGPYTVQVEPQRNVIPSAAAKVAVRVVAASGEGVGGIDVTVEAGGSAATVTTGPDGRASTSVIASAAASTQVLASAAVPTQLTYLNTRPPSVALAPLATVTGTGVLQPVLHPRPTVRVSTDRLAFAGASMRPALTVGGTSGYSGTGDVSLLGPVAPVGGACSAVPADTLDAAPAAWRQSFTFTGDATLDAAPTPQLAAGCYILHAAVTTTNSSPPERASADPVPVTVTALHVAAAASAPAALPGGLAATVTATDAGRASVRTTVVARGPLPIEKGGCTGDFADAPEAGRSTATALPADTETPTTVEVPDVRKIGCYALQTRSDVSVDGLTATTSTPAPDATMAVLQPGIAVDAAALSSERGQPVPGTVRVTGTYGFAGTVAVGVVAGRTIPITGCRDTRFGPALTPARTSTVAVRGDAAYRFRTPPTSRVACYSVVATYTLTGNKDVRATSAAPTDSTVFLAGVRPDGSVGTVLQRTAPGSVRRAAIAYGVFGALMLLGCMGLFARTFRRDRKLVPTVDQLLALGAMASEHRD